MSSFSQNTEKKQPKKKVEIVFESSDDEDEQNEKVTKVTRVVKIKRKNGNVVQDCDVYIGRACNMGGWKLKQSKWHNPFKLKDYNDIDKVLELYEKHVRSQKHLMNSLEELRGKVLGCWCKNKTTDKCHGDVLVKLLNEKKEKVEVVEKNINKEQEKKNVEKESVEKKKVERSKESIEQNIELDLIIQQDKLKNININIEEYIDVYQGVTYDIIENNDGIVIDDNIDPRYSPISSPGMFTGIFTSQ